MSDQPMKRCSKCGNEYPATAEYFHRQGLGFKSECRACRNKFGLQRRRFRNEYVEGRKRCSRGDKCVHLGGPWLPVEEFGRDNRRSDGLDCYCRACGHSDYIKHRHLVREKRDGMKRCSQGEKCSHLDGPWLPLTEFWRCRSTADGLVGYCKVCGKEKNKLWCAEHPDKENERHRVYRLQHPGWASERGRVSRTKHPEEVKARGRRYYVANAEKAVAYNQRWRAEHPEKRREQSKRYAIKHADELRAKGQRYRVEHPDIIRASSHRRRACIAGADGTHTAADIALQIKAQTDKKGRLHCWWCGKPIKGGYHVEHVYPLSRGGSNGPENIVLSCGACNLHKSTKTPSEFMGRLL